MGKFEVNYKNLVYPLTIYLWIVIIGPGHIFNVEYTWLNTYKWIHNIIYIQMDHSVDARHWGLYWDIGDYIVLNNYK